MKRNIALILSSVGLFYGFNHYLTPPVTAASPAEAVATVYTPPALVISAVTGSHESKKIINVDIPSEQVIFLEGEIGPQSAEVAAQIIRKSKNKKIIHIMANSPGGSVMDGGLISSAIEASPVPVYFYVEQFCASMCAMISQYATKRFMVDRSILMFHSASGGVSGTLEQMSSRLNMISQYVYKMDSHVSDRVGISLEDYHNKTVRELWLDAEEALKGKYIDGIVQINIDGMNKVFAPAGSNFFKSDKFNINWF